MNTSLRLLHFINLALKVSILVRVVLPHSFKFRAWDQAVSNISNRHLGSLAILRPPLRRQGCPD